MLALTAAYAATPTALALLHKPRGATYTWVNGPFPVDQMQYLAWVRQFGHHLLVSSPYSGARSRRVFLQPLLAVSGWLTRLGLSPAISYLLWLPVCAVIQISGAWLYAKRMVDGPRSRAVCFALGLLFVSPLSALVLLGHVGNTSSLGQGIVTVSNEASTTTVLWGYLSSALAVGLIPWCLLHLERAADPARRGRASPRRCLVISCVAAGFCAWLHPWQGEDLAIILTGLLIWPGVAKARRVVVAPLIATALPLAYYGGLPHVDTAWREAQALAHAARWPVVALVLALAPLLVPAALARRPTSWDLQERAVVLWVVAAIGVALFTKAFPQHALEGVAIPLAVLATRGARMIARRAVPTKRLMIDIAAVAAVASLTIPGMASAADNVNKGIAAMTQPYYLRPGELAALKYLGRFPSGVVMTTAYLGSLVPVYSGRTTWVGHPAWQSDYDRRSRETSMLFSGQLPPAAARTLVEGSGVAFLVEDCQQHVDLQAVLGPLITTARHFGCATVYQTSRAAGHGKT